MEPSLSPIWNADRVGKKIAEIAEMISASQTKFAASQERSVLAYRQLVFDCDGVLFDSNEIKAGNIRAAAAPHCNAQTLDRFVAYFVAHNGIPRQEKVISFFGDPAIQTAILERYAELNAGSFGFLDLIPAARAFLEGLLSLGIPLYALTGGEKRETAAVLERAGVASYFVQILGGPKSKAVHLAELRLEGPTCLFGDSAHDYTVAESFGFDFVFLARYNQMHDWAEFFSERPGVFIAHDFESLIDWLPC